MACQYSRLTVFHTGRTQSTTIHGVCLAVGLIPSCVFSPGVQSCSFFYTVLAYNNNNFSWRDYHLSPATVSARPRCTQSSGVLASILHPDDPCCRFLLPSLCAAQMRRRRDHWLTRSNNVWRHSQLANQHFLNQESFSITWKYGSEGLV